MAIKNEIMMQIGAFKFAADAAAYQSLKRVSEYQWQAQARLGRNPALQYLGKGSESIELSGMIYPAEFHTSIDQVAAMRKEAAKGNPLLLISAKGMQGEILGLWVIQKIEETGTIFAAGGSPRKIDFRMSLQFHGGDA